MKRKIEDQNKDENEKLKMINLKLNYLLKDDPIFNNKKPSKFENLCNFIVHFILLAFYIFIFYHFVVAIGSYIYNKFIMVYYFYPTLSLNWNCSEKKLIIPIHDNYFESNYKYNYIECYNDSTTIYRELQNYTMFTNEEQFMDFVINKTSNYTYRQHKLYLPFSMDNNNSIFIDLSYKTIHKNTLFYYLLELNCIQDKISIINSTQIISEKSSNTLVIKEFSNNCTKILYN